MRTELPSLLPKIVKNPNLHARWLNTFSYVEHIGLRKIIKSQTGQSLDRSILERALAEGGHALLLKNLAIEVGGNEFKTYAPDKLICVAEAENYFQSVDRVCESRIRSDRIPQNATRLNYLYVTWLLEQRGISVYESYHDALRDAGVELPLSNLLNEQKIFLQEVEHQLLESDANFHARSTDLAKVEEILYRTYTSALAEYLKNFVTRPDELQG